MSGLPITHVRSRDGRPDVGTTAVAGAAGIAGAPSSEHVRVPYDRPVIKPPVWSWEIPLYFYTGGVAGGAAAFAHAAHLADDATLARRAWAVALAGAAVSPVLLIADLGVPRRFFNMLRVVKVTSPMSIGSWLLSALGTATGVAALHAWTGLLPGPARVARPVAAVTGVGVATYTAALIADTAVPVWHGARRELPFVFAASAAASSAALVTLASAEDRSAPARRLMAGGGVVELAAMQVMERRLGELAHPYHHGGAARYARAAKALTLAGAIGAGFGRHPLLHRAAALLVSAGAVCERWAIFTAGSESAADPAATVRPQRRRITEGLARGAARFRPRGAASAAGSPATAPVELPAQG